VFCLLYRERKGKDVQRCCGRHSSPIGRSRKTENRAQERGGRKKSKRVLVHQAKLGYGEEGRLESDDSARSP